MKRLGITEWITVIALLGLIGTFAGLFFFEQNRSRSAGDEEVIGSLLFRYRVAERKFSDTVLWDRVDPGDSLRNMDWIRTDAYSEAIFELKDGSRVEMSPETMLILSFDGKEKSIQIENGSAKLDLKDSYTVKTHAETLESMKGEFRIQNKDGNLSLEKTDGTASFHGRPLEDGWYQIGKEGIKKQTSPIQLISPID
ncbi:MAG: FecR domain-containing protein, partial [Leptospiraceae bacterium]|nr:FecR domain-containing protein [Leptospiraceae bacterium]